MLSLGLFPRPGDPIQRFLAARPSSLAVKWESHARDTNDPRGEIDSPELIILTVVSEEQLVAVREIFLQVRKCQSLRTISGKHPKCAPTKV